MNDSATQTADTFKVKAVNSDADFCECCGKEGLSRVVWVENMETGELKHFGTTCAMNPNKGVGRKAVKSMMNWTEQKTQYCKVNSFENGKVNTEKFEFYWKTYPNQ